MNPFDNHNNSLEPKIYIKSTMDPDPGPDIIEEGIKNMENEIRKVQVINTYQF